MFGSGHSRIRGRRESLAIRLACPDGTAGQTWLVAVAFATLLVMASAQSQQPSNLGTESNEDGGGAYGGGPAGADKVAGRIEDNAAVDAAGNDTVANSTTVIPTTLAASTLASNGTVAPPLAPGSVPMSEVAGECFKKLGGISMWNKCQPPHDPSIEGNLTASCAASYNKVVCANNQSCDDPKCSYKEAQAFETWFNGMIQQVQTSLSCPPPAEKPYVCQSALGPDDKPGDDGEAGSTDDAKKGMSTGLVILIIVVVVIVVIACGVGLCMCMGDDEPPKKNPPASSGGGGHGSSKPTGSSKAASGAGSSKATGSSKAAASKAGSSMGASSSSAAPKSSVAGGKSKVGSSVEAPGSKAQAPSQVKSSVSGTGARPSQAGASGSAVKSQA